MSENGIIIKTSTTITAGNEFDKEIWAKIQHLIHKQTTPGEDVDPFIANVTVSLELKDSDFSYNARSSCRRRSEKPRNPNSLCI